MTSDRPLFILFINSVISLKIIELVEVGRINAIIYCPNTLSLKIKKLFSKKMVGNFRINELNLPFTPIMFDLLLTSKTFWDNIDNENTNIYNT